MKELMEKYGDDIKIVFVQNPLGFHDRAMPASKGAYAAHLQGKFWEYHDLVFEHNKELDDETLESHAKALGLDMEKWKKDKDSKEVEDWLKGHQGLAAALGATGTPAWFINGELLTGAQPVEEFAKIIDKQLAKANFLVEKKGFDVATLHAALSRKAVDGKYKRYVIDGAKAPAPKGKEAAADKEPFAKRAMELPVSDSPREGTGDEVVMAECSDFQ